MARSHTTDAARLGHGAFRLLVTDAYQRRCAVTGERTLPVLDAAHIRPEVVQRGRGFGPVAVTSRCGTQSSTWWKPSNVPPCSSTTSRSERR